MLRAFLLGLLLSSPALADDVILLHGLCRTTRSMAVMEKALAREGYRVWNVGYPSRTAAVRELADATLPRALARARAAGATRIHFVTHSMGGILVRSFLSRNDIPELGRVVMLGPPNGGSEVVDRLRNRWYFGKINGPAGFDLGTDAASVPNTLPPVDFPVGIIAGRSSINWINSSAYLPGPDDGKVTVERTKVAGMTDHVVLDATHAFMASNRLVIAQTIRFLRTGKFGRDLE